MGSGEFLKPVAGAAHSYVGNYLCTSGAESGALGDIKVVQTGAWVVLSHGQLCFDMVIAGQVNHLSAAAEGDSRGPVFSLTDGGSRVIAKGTISGIDTSRPGQQGMLSGLMHPVLPLGGIPPMNRSSSSSPTSASAGRSRISTGSMIVVLSRGGSIVSGLRQTAARPPAVTGYALRRR